MLAKSNEAALACVRLSFLTFSERCEQISQMKATPEPDACSCEFGGEHLEMGRVGGDD